MKTCVMCKVSKPHTDFSKSPVNRDGLMGRCRACNVKNTREWRAKNPERAFAQDLWRRYGITLAAYKGILRKQKGRCAICRRKPEDCGKRGFAVDHDHATGKVRGILCSSCNRGISYLGDDPERLKSAARYLGASS